MTAPNSQLKTGDWRLGIADLGAFSTQSPIPGHQSSEFFPRIAGRPGPQRPPMQELGFEVTQTGSRRSKRCDQVAVRGNL